MLQHVIDGVDLVDRYIKEREIRNKHDEFAHGQTMLQHFGCAEPEDHGPAETPDQHHAWGVVGPEVHGLQGVLPTMIALPIESLLLIGLSLIHISEPTRLLSISYAVFCLKKKNY